MDENTDLTSQEPEMNQVNEQEQSSEESKYIDPEKKSLIKEYVEDKDQNTVPASVNKNLCDGCTICCEHVAIQIDEPEDEDDYNNIIWYVMHKNIIVFLDDEDDWYIEFKTPCKALTEKGLCDIHLHRPKVCVEYSQDSCERYGDGSPYEVLFKTREDVVGWVRKNTEFKNFGK